MREKEENFEEKKTKKSHKKPLIIVGIIVATLAVIYIGVGVFFQSHFLFNTTINGVDASCKTVKTVKNAIKNEANNYSIEIIEPNGNTLTVMASDVDISINLDSGEIENLLESQNGFAWIKSLKEPSDCGYGEIVEYDRNKLTDVLSQISCIDDPNAKPSQDATFEFKGGKFVVVDEVYGTQVELSDLTTKVGEAILFLRPSFNIAKDGGYLLPNVTADTKELVDFIDNLNSIIDSKIVYDLGDIKEEIPQAEKAKWFKFGEDYSLEYDEVAMGEFIDSMSAKYNTYGHSKKLDTTADGEIEVPGGNYGWKIDKEGELAQLKEDIASGNDVSRDFVYSSVANSHSKKDYGDSYVEINLTAQHLYLYKNGKLVVESDFVSGNPFKGNETPTGAYQVTYTEKDAVLRGVDYATPVTYWMPFAGNVGMHDLKSRKAFGGQIYLGNGSHGCVNLPLNAAKTIFENIEKGYPVLVYKTEYTDVDIEVAAAKEVVKLIKKIGDDPVATADIVAQARAQYELLPERVRGAVTNYDLLVAAEAVLNPVPATDPALSGVWGI